MSIVCDDIVFLDLFADGRDAAGGDIIEKGLSHLDAEAVNWFSRRRTNVRQRANSRLKSHIKR